RDLAHEDLAGLRERDDRRRSAHALGVGDDGGLAALENGDDGVGGTEVDADCTCHEECLPDVLRSWGCRAVLSQPGSSLRAPNCLRKFSRSKLRLIGSTIERTWLFPLAACQSRSFAQRPSETTSTRSPSSTIADCSSSTKAGLSSPAAQRSASAIVLVGNRSRWGKIEKLTTPRPRSSGAPDHSTK